MPEYMNPLEAEPEKICVRHRKELRGSIYALLFLFVTTYSLHRALAVYLDRLLHGGHISRWTFEDRNRVEKIKVELDQYCDLLRQRRALREFGRDPKRGTLPYADKFAGGSRSLSPYGRLQRSRHPC